MRIALVAQSCDNETGIGRVVLNLAKEFVRFGQLVHIVGQRIEGVPEAIQQHRIAPILGFPAFNKLLFRYRAPTIVRELDCDVIDSFGVGRVATIVTAGSCHRAGMEILKNADRGRIRSRTFGLFDAVSLSDERYLFTSSATRKVIAVSNLVKNQIVAYYATQPDHICVIPNGVDFDALSRVHESIDRARLRDSFHLTPDHFVLLFVGNEFFRKGLQTVIDALSILRDQQQRLLVVGGDDPAPFKRLAADVRVSGQVQFLGRISAPEKLFAAADAFVLPTLYEPFGMVIIEAMAAGLPAVVTRRAGAVEGMKDGTVGLFLQDPTSAEELAAIVARLKNDEGLRLSLTKNAQVEARRFSWDVVARKTLEVYGETESLPEGSSMA